MKVKLIMQKCVPLCVQLMKHNYSAYSFIEITYYHTFVRITIHNIRTLLLLLLHLSTYNVFMKNHFKFYRMYYSVKTMTDNF